MKFNAKLNNKIKPNNVKLNNKIKPKLNNEIKLNNDMDNFKPNNNLKTNNKIELNNNKLDNEGISNIKDKNRMENINLNGNLNENLRKNVKMEMPKADIKDKKRILMIAPTPFFSDRGCHIRILHSYLRLKREGNDIILLTYPIGRNINGINTSRILKISGYKKLGVGFSYYKPFLDLLLYLRAKKLMN